jgi:hypothetical protein
MKKNHLPHSPSMMETIRSSASILAQDHTMKRSRRVVLTMMGTAAVGAVSMGFVPGYGCGPGRVPVVVPGPDGRPMRICRVTYGGFGGGPGRFYGHGHMHGGG